ncbi:MAG: hypothetical protein AAF572_22180 [Cyanobacteria bacterium P01_B01_bin.77]
MRETFFKILAHEIKHIFELRQQGNKNGIRRFYNIMGILPCGGGASRMARQVGWD